MALTPVSMSEFGYGLLFVWVLAEQAGLPIPTVPMLLAAGAMAADGKLHFGMAIFVGLVGSMLADVAWYEAGRYRGISLIHSLCRLSLEKDSCARRAQMLYGIYGAFALIIAKFVPGLNFVAPPLSGVFHMRRWRFLLFDAAGALAWLVAYMSLGFLFSNQLTAIAHRAEASGQTLVALGLIAAIALFISWKVRRRKRFALELRVATITPEDLKFEIDHRTPLTIIDVRHPLDVLSTPFTLPNAIRIPLETIGTGASNLSRDHGIVIYCTCPNQASSSLTLQLLRRYGFSRVRVLAGGFQAWRDKGFEIQGFEAGPSNTKSSDSIWAF